MDDGKGRVETKIYNLNKGESLPIEKWFDGLKNSI